MALGATRWRLARQLLSESLLLGAFGASLGLLLSLWGQYLLASAMADQVPLINATHLDSTVVAFCVVLTLVVCTVCGLIPLIDWGALDWNARGQSEGRSSRQIRHALVVGEVALAVTVVASAGLLLRTVANLRAVDVGFETDRTIVVSTDLTTSPLRERGGAARFVQDVIPRVAALPGVRGTAAWTGVPFEGGPATQAITRYGDPPIQRAVPCLSIPQTRCARSERSRSICSCRKESTHPMIICSWQLAPIDAVAPTVPFPTVRPDWPELSQRWTFGVILSAHL